jgi:hypothetical protein
MKPLTRVMAPVLCGALVIAGTAYAQTVERLTDKDVKTLIEAVDHGRDRFEDQLDGKLKDSILRGPGGEVNVSKFLDDFQENVTRLKDRFTPQYAASTEAGAVLRQATSIHAFMKQQTPGLKGSSEWDHLAGDFGRLAVVYGTKFPLEKDEPVRRINDGEAATAAAQIEGQASEFKDAVNREKTLAKSAKDGLKRYADLVKNAAKALKSRLKDSKPATAEARQLFQALGTMRESAKGLSPASLTVMGEMQAPLATLSQAFGLTAPGPAGTN